MLQFSRPMANGFNLVNKIETTPQWTVGHEILKQNVRNIFQVHVMCEKTCVL